MVFQLSGFHFLGEVSFTAGVAAGATVEDAVADGGVVFGDLSADWTAEMGWTDLIVGLDDGLVIKMGALGEG